MSKIRHEKWLENFIFQLRLRKTTSDLFNQWRSIDASLERKDSAKIRCENCVKYFGYWLNNPPKLLLIGEAPGYAGSRFTGVSFTSERIILEGNLPGYLQRLKLSTTSLRENGYGEPSATIIWGEILKANIEVALWMAVPWHPHLPYLPLTNRKPTAKEIEAGLPILEMVLSAFPKCHVGAVGRIAEKALKTLGRSFDYLRHPAQAGARKFREGFTELIAKLS